jgi:type IV pilus assembly protein PilB
VQNPKDSAFVERVLKLPHFEFAKEVSHLASRHGNTPQLVQAIVDEHYLSKEDACRYWADSINTAYVDPFASIVTDEAVLSIPMEVAKKANVIGLYVINNVLTVAMPTPTDPAMVRRISQIVQIPISAVFALPREVEDAIAVHYCTEKGLEESLSELERSNIFDRPDMSAEKLAAFAENNALIQIFDDIIYFAMRERATDIHIEAQETHCRIRFRVDGNLREILTYSRRLHRALLSRVKILSNLNLSESRFPQDGRFSMQVGSQAANFRVSTLPSAFGEKAVIRLLATAGKKVMLTLEKMMMSQSILQPFKRLLQNSSGIIFVTGPTGSGKTTTLYSAVSEINHPGVNITTIEDPIEIQMTGVTQSQVNLNIDLKFSTILRALMRQDPDVILIGEIRDLETAKIATEAALTGHMVFATLHTNTAPQAVVRLMEIGVEPYMVAPSLIGVLSQRLAARICEACKEAYYPSRETLQKYFHDEGLTEVPFYRGRGCPACRNSGYKGRVAFHELVLMTEEVRTLITKGCSVQEISRAAAKIGYKPLRYDGLKKVLLGLTTIEEVEQNTSFEWAPA